MKKLLVLSLPALFFHLNASEALVGAFHKKSKAVEQKVVKIPKKTQSTAEKCKALAKQIMSEKLQAYEVTSSVQFSMKHTLSTGQLLVLLGENHTLNEDHPKGNLKLRNTFIELFDLADEFEAETPAFHMLVEHTMPVNNERVVSKGVIPPTVLHGLYLHAKAKKEAYRRSTEENCEIRDAYCVVKDIMDIVPEEDQYRSFEEDDFIHEAIKEYHTYDVRTITWRTLIEDFDRLVEKYTEKGNAWNNELIQEQFDAWLKKAKRFFEKPKNRILQRESDPLFDDSNDPTILKADDQILAYYHLYGDAPLKKQMKSFLSQLTRAFSPFIELEMFQRVLELRKEAQVPIIVVYGGESHCRELNALLQRAELSEDPLTFLRKECTLDKLGWLAEGLPTVDKIELAAAKSLHELDNGKEPCYDSSNIDDVVNYIALVRLRNIALILLSLAGIRVLIVSTSIQQEISNSSMNKTVEEQL